jgi:dynein heavy chain
LIPGDLHYVEKERIEYMIDTMLNEINKDYFNSVKKSILDYILKDETEMRRLGIQQVIDEPITWGEDFYKGITPDEEWKHNVMMARMLMSENLCICSQATLELMRIWREKDYYQKVLVNLPEEGDPPVSLAEFNSM